MNLHYFHLKRTSFCGICFKFQKLFSRDEGIVLKDLGSKWEPGDRSGKWLKLKPDYIHAGSDLDVLIIGSSLAFLVYVLVHHIN